MPMINMHTIAQKFGVSEFWNFERNYFYSARLHFKSTFYS